MAVQVQPVGFRIRGSGFGVWGFGIRVRVQGSGFRVKEFRV
jgi:hypothetical protein